MADESTVDATLAVGAVAGIGVVWRWFTSFTGAALKRVTKKLDECEKQHAKAEAEMSDLKYRIGLLEGMAASEEDRVKTRELIDCMITKLTTQDIQ